MDLIMFVNLFKLPLFCLGLINAENGALEGWEEMKSLAGEDRTGEDEEQQQAARMDRFFNMCDQNGYGC